jgi:hypothetical protein
LLGLVDEVLILKVLGGPGRLVDPKTPVTPVWPHNNKVRLPANRVFIGLRATYYMPTRFCNTKLQFCTAVTTEKYF